MKINNKVIFLKSFFLIGFFLLLMWWTQGLFVLPKKYKVVSSKGHSYEAFLVHLTNSNAVSLVLDIRRSNLQSAIKVLCFIMSRYSRPPNSSLYVRNVPSNERFVFNCWICAMTFSRKHVLLFIVLHDQTWQPNVSLTSTAVFLPMF